MGNPKEYKLPEEDNFSMACEPQKSWGGQWTEDKLEIFEKYVRAYLTIMSKSVKKFYWTLIYFDAFAGSGSREVEAEDFSEPKDSLFSPEELIEVEEQASYKGAAERVLGIEGFSFDYYYFVDNDEDSLHALEEKLKRDFPEKAGQMGFKLGDANEKILELVRYAEKHPECAALVLLDPFGMQLKWETIQELKKIKHIDLWILVPSGIGINRLLTRNGKINNPEKMVNMFGKPIEELEAYFYEKVKRPSLFGEQEWQIKRDNTINRIAKLYLTLLGKEFGCVIDEPLVLRNSRNCPIYHFVFASHNPTAKKIASEIVGKKNREK